MRQIALLALLLAFAAAVYGQENILEKGLEGRSAADVISRRYVTPLRLVALPGELTAGVENPEALLRNFDGQLTTGTPDVCRLSTRDGARLPCCSISARSCAAGSRSRRRYAPTSGR